MVFLRNTGRERSVSGVYGRERRGASSSGRGLHKQDSLAEELSALDPSAAGDGSCAGGDQLAAVRLELKVLQQAHTKLLEQLADRTHADPKPRVPSTLDDTATAQESRDELVRQLQQCTVQLDEKDKRIEDLLAQLSRANEDGARLDGDLARLRGELEVLDALSVHCAVGNGRGKCDPILRGRAVSDG